MKEAYEVNSETQLEVLKLEEQLALTRVLLRYAAINFHSVMAHSDELRTVVALTEAICLMNACSDFGATVQQAMLA